MTHGMYEAAWGDNEKVRLLLSDALYAAACSEAASSSLRQQRTRARGKIVHRYKNRVRSKHGRRIEEQIDWDNPRFAIRRLWDTPAP